MKELFIGIVIFFIIIYIWSLIERFEFKEKKRREMGTLTGIYYHEKSHDSVVPYYLMVQHEDIQGFVEFKVATVNDIKLLRKYKYLK